MVGFRSPTKNPQPGHEVPRLSLRDVHPRNARGHGRILIVDSDPVIRSGICSYLTDHGFLTRESGDCRDAHAQLLRSRPDALLLDVYSPEGNAAELMIAARRLQPPVPVLLLAGKLGWNTSGPVFRDNADAMLSKPVDMAELYATLLRVLKGERRGDKATPLPEKLQKRVLDPFVGTSSAIAELRNVAGRVAGSQSPVLIQGETGTGKGVLAKWIHRNGPRARKPFLDLNCAGLSRELLESELFGHQKGAFTSAIATKQGLLEIADGGTVFLDEVADMDLQVQSKLLKVLEDRTFRRVGDVRDRDVDMRLISASHRDLQKMVEQQLFRSDLYYRVNIVWLQLPPLRERREDILPLSQNLLADICRQWGRSEARLLPSAVAALESYSWPGNIRELRNVLERALVLAESDNLGAQHLQFQSELRIERFTPENHQGTLKQVERAHIRRVLEFECGSIERAARTLGIPRSSLYNKMRRFQIPHGTGRDKCELPMSAAAD